MKIFHLSFANGVRQQPKNHTYETQIEVNSLEEFKQATQWDNVGAIYKDNHRKNENFISADCLMMDCDNEGSDNPNDWLTPDNFSEKIPDVAFYVMYSKNHMRNKQKKTGEIKSARPRWHVYFPLSDICTNADALRAMKEKFLRVFPDFDSGAKDSARFFFGVENPDCGVQEGNLCIDDFLDTVPDIEIHNATDAKLNSPHESKEPHDSEVIPDGKRHNYLLQVALQALGKYGISEKARKIFDNACLKCQQPLDLQNVADIWTWAVSQAEKFKDRYTPKKQTLTLPIIEQTLKQFNIDVRFDVITKRIVISDLPVDNPYVPESYSAVNGFTRKETNKKALPLFLRTFFKDNNFTFASDFIYDSLDVIALTHSYNPFFEMIQKKTWDGENRIYKLCQVLGITSKNFHYMKLLEKWLWQCVSMSLNDDGALRNEFVLVLKGSQGIGKTSVLEKIAVMPDWFAEGKSIDTNNKDDIIESTSVLICELGELESTLNREQASLKAFLNRKFDEYRAPYGKAAVRYVRRTTFCATVNSEQFLRDVTGNRRYVVIPVSDIDLSFIHNHMTKEYCSQLWRQVYEQYYIRHGKNGFYLTDDERSFSENNNVQSTVMKDGEIELYDLLDWEQPVSYWKWYTNSELLKALELRISATRMGTALSAIMMKDSRVRKEHNKKGNLYLLPPKKNIL